MTLAARRTRGSLVSSMAVAFVVTVMATRVYLELTGFPSIGSGKLHLAHAVWGGLLLIVAALLPLLFAPSRVLPAAAILAGVGAGLFIDEVGKFLTSDNDYFFAPAAPLIYGCGLLLVLLAVRSRERTAVTTADRWYAALDLLGEAADDHLSQQEAARARDLLAEVAADPARPALAGTAASLRADLAGWAHLPEHRPSRLAGLVTALDRGDRRAVPAGAYGTLAVLAGLGVLAYALLAGLVGLLLAVDSGLRTDLGGVVDSGGLVSTPVAVTMLWISVAACLASIGMLAIAVVARLRGRRVPAATWTVRAMVLVLVVVNLAASYLDISVLAVLLVFQLLGLGIVLRYRTRVRATEAATPD